MDIKSALLGAVGGTVVVGSLLLLSGSSGSVLPPLDEAPGSGGFVLTIADICLDPNADVDFVYGGQVDRTEVRLKRVNSIGNTDEYLLTMAENQPADAMYVAVEHVIDGQVDPKPDAAPATPAFLNCVYAKRVATPEVR